MGSGIVRQVLNGLKWLRAALGSLVQPQGRSGIAGQDLDGVGHSWASLKWYIRALCGFWQPEADQKRSGMAWKALDGVGHSQASLKWLKMDPPVYKTLQASTGHAGNFLIFRPIWETFWT